MLEQQDPSSPPIPMTQLLSQAPFPSLPKLGAPFPSSHGPIMLCFGTGWGVLNGIIMC